MRWEFLMQHGSSEMTNFSPSASHPNRVLDVAAPVHLHRKASAGAIKQEKTQLHSVSIVAEDRIGLSASSPRILRMRDICYYTGLSRSTIFELARKGGPSFDSEFPKRIRISGTSAIGFDSRELFRWIELQIAKRGER
jgi:prophage regulatory protein